MEKISSEARKRYTERIKEYKERVEEITDKNKDLDRWISRIRAPYESVFSKQRKRVRYCGIEKNQFAAFM